MSLQQDMKARVARYEDRREDWSVFGFETQIDPKFARSQRRYVGASGSVDHHESNAVAPVAFTMSIQTMPAGHRIPTHCHETEETFFILEGRCRVTIFRDDEEVSISLAKWDLVSLPAFVHHDIENDGPGECAIQTLLSKPRPDRPNYQDPRLLAIQAETISR